MKESAVDKLTTETLQDFANSSNIVVTTSYTKYDEENGTSTALPKATALAEASALQATREAVFMQAAQNISTFGIKDNESDKPGEFRDSYMELTHAAADQGGGSYLFTVDAEWLTMAVGAVFFLLCGCFVRVGLITAVALVLGWASYLMGKQENLWLQALSLVHKADIAALYQGCIFLNLFSRPVWQLPVIAVFWMLLLGISFALGLVLHCRRPAITAVKSTVGRKGLCFGLHTNLAVHECRKLLVMRGGALVLMLLAVVQVASYWDFDEPDDLHYRQYAEVLAGSPSADVILFPALQRQ